MEAEELIRDQNNIKFVFQILKAGHTHLINASNLQFRSDLNGLSIELKEVEKSMKHKKINFPVFMQMLTQIQEQSKTPQAN